MFNVMLDPLPTEYKGFQIDSDFQIGIQMFQALNDEELTEQERMLEAISLLFPDKDEEGNKLPYPDFNTAVEGVQWFLSRWYQDNTPEEKDKTKVTDYDIDQWRIYSAFRSQYNINLNTDSLHFWEFMGLLSTLEECAYTRVIGIRQRKFEGKMGAKERAALRKAKEIYTLEQPEEDLTDEEQEAIAAFDELLKKQR